MFKRAKTGSIIIIAMIFLLCGGLISASTIYAAVDDREIKVMLDGNELSFDVPPTIIGGRTLVPLRVIFEALGATVDWNPNTGTVTGEKGDVDISLKINSNSAYVNGELIKIDVPATVINGRTLIPARFIAESLGADVGWEETSRTVIIVSPKAVSFPDPKLEEAVRESIKKPKGEILTSDLKKITYLFASGKGISNLQGIQYLVNMKDLYLDNNEISDISLLSGNTNLEELSLSKNRIADITPLKDLAKLTYLNASSNQITDILPLKNLSKLITLNLSINQINDIGILKDITSLTGLNLCGNPIVDISALKSLDGLKELYLMHFTEKDAINSDLFGKFEAMEKKVKEIISKVVSPEMSELEKELAIHDYIVLNSVYDEENLIKNTLPDESHMPYGILINGTGVCDGYARTFQVLLNAAGIESKVVIGDFDPLNGSALGLAGGNSLNDAAKWKHAWNIAKIDNKYYHVDITADDPVIKNDTGLLSHQYFNVSDKQIAVDHKWDRLSYERCLYDSSDFMVNIGERKDIIITTDNYFYIDSSGMLRKKALEGDADVRLCDDKASDINLMGEWLFYINESDKRKIYKVKTDGTGRVKLNDEETWRMVLNNDSIYYLADKRIKRMNFDGTGQTAINSDDVTTWMDISDGFIYFKAYNWSSGARLYKMDLNGNGKTQLCYDEPAGFTLSDDGREVTFFYAYIERRIGEWIYFINESDGKKIYKVKTSGNERIKIGDDSIDDSSIEFLGDYIYYKSVNDKYKYYRIRLDGTHRQLLE